MTYLKYNNIHRFYKLHNYDNVYNKKKKLRGTMMLSILTQVSYLLCRDINVNVISTFLKVKDKSLYSRNDLE